MGARRNVRGDACARIDMAVVADGHRAEYPYITGEYLAVPDCRVTSLVGAVWRTNPAAAQGHVLQEVTVVSHPRLLAYHCSPAMIDDHPATDGSRGVDLHSGPHLGLLSYASR